MSFRQVRLVTTSFLVCWLAIPSNPNAATAQENCVGYRLIQETVYEQTPVKMTKWVTETVYEKKKVTEYKHVWNTEKRERRTTVLKPVRKTTDREERYVIRTPVTETKYRERQTEETVYETVTEMQDQEVVIEYPVYETVMREEKVIVKRPVTEQVMRNEIVTTYRPSIVEQTQLATSNLQIDQLVPFSTGSLGPRMRWLTPGYHTDPVTGQTVFRRRGLHWVQQPAVTGFQLQTTNVPVLTQQTVNRLALVPETVQTQTPVEVTRYVEQVETRKVPVRVEKMNRRVEVRKVPVEVKRPKIVVRTERIPYEVTRYVDRVVVQKVPVTETTYEQVERVEPYEVVNAQWVPITREISVPKIVRRAVEVDMIKHSPKTITMKVPIDAFGKIVGPAQPLFADQTAKAKPIPTPATTDNKGGLEETSARTERSIMESKETLENTDVPTEYHARPVLRDEHEPKESSVLSLKPSNNFKPLTNLVPVKPRGNQSLEKAEDKQSATQQRSTDNQIPETLKPIRKRDEVALDAADTTPTLKSPPPSSDPVINGPTSNGGTSEADSEQQ